MTSTAAFADGSNPIKVQWARFDFGATRVFQSSSLYTNGPQVAFTPKFKLKESLDWLEIAPRLDFQFNKDSSGKTNALYSLGVQGLTSFNDDYYIAPEVSLWTTQELSKTVTYHSLGLWGGYKLDPSEGVTKHLEYVAIGYRRHFSTIEFSQLSLVAGIDFN